MTFRLASNVLNEEHLIISHKTNSKFHIKKIPVAQLVEHPAVTREVVSSSPVGPILRVLK